ncbi:ShlB/FhaC/HecB family hemolysin secretion/activation protein [Caulobacter sp. KR2-114]|uniref:ShlB/FhaC/HecB family hemolysin secretion/activation protein n=1 Tax=Caulobacter sp. KR2-114 TaxID=3400912 RepID=UPI003C0502C7
MATRSIMDVPGAPGGKASRARGALLWACLPPLALAASAQAGEDPDAPVSRAAPELSQQIPAARPGANPLTAPPAGGTCPFAGQGMTVTLSKVTLDGASVVTPQEVTDAVSGLLGAPHDLGVVCQVRDRVAAIFTRKGFRLTRVDVPPQRIEGGVLRLQATEGYVSSVDTDGLAALGPSAVLVRSYFSPLLGERPLRWPDLERAVLLARDTPGADIGVRVHGSGPGAVEVVATARPRRKFDLSLGLQNLGNDELGRTALYGRLDANSFTRFADRTSLVLFSTSTGDQKVVEGIESFAIGPSGLRLQGEADYAHTTPGGALAPLQIAGDFLDASVRLDYPVLRSQTANIVATARFDYINQKNDLGILRGLTPGEPILFEDRLRLLTLSLDMRWRPDSQPHLDSELSGSLVQGVGGLGGSRRGDPTLSRAQGDPLATVLRADGSLRWTGRGRQGFQATGGPWIELRASGQIANHPLTAYEEFQIGNYTIGRGYSPGAASGDRAIGGQLEAGWRFAYKNASFGAGRGWIEPYAFVDAARLSNLDTGGYSSTIASVGGGVRTLLPWRLQLDLAYADPLRRPFPGAPDPKGRVLLTLSRVFSFR